MKNYVEKKGIEKRPVYYQSSIGEAKTAYPVAAAYLDILFFSQSNPASKVGWVKSRLGDEAVVAILGGGDVIAARNQMLDAYQCADITSNND